MEIIKRKAGKHMKIGFTGCGNMGSAMMRGIIASGKCAAENIMASDTLPEALRSRKEELGILTATDNREVAEFAEVLFCP